MSETRSGDFLTHTVDIDSVSACNSILPGLVHDRSVSLGLERPECQFTAASFKTGQMLDLGIQVEKSCSCIS